MTKLDELKQEMEATAKVYYDTLMEHGSDSIEHYNASNHYFNAFERYLAVLVGARVPAIWFPTKKQCNNNIGED